MNPERNGKCLGRGIWETKARTMTERRKGCGLAPLEIASCTSANTDVALVRAESMIVLSVGNLEHLQASDRMMNRGSHLAWLVPAMFVAGCASHRDAAQSNLRNADVAPAMNSPYVCEDSVAGAPSNLSANAPNTRTSEAPDTVVGRSDVSGPSTSASETPPTTDPEPIMVHRVGVLHIGRPRHQSSPSNVVLNILGIHVTASDLIAAAARLRAAHVDTVILDITMQGGYWSEAQSVQHVLRTEFIPHFRTIAWVDEAVGGAALGFMVVPEVYFRPNALYGPCPVASSGSASDTPWVTNTVVGFGPSDLVTQVMRDACKAGGHDERLARSMMFGEPLSVTVGSDGVLRLSNDEQPGRVVNSAGRLLALNATSGVRVGFSRGTAESVNDVMRFAGVRVFRIVGEAATEDLDFAAARARTDESRLLDLLESVRSRLLLTDSAIEGWERDAQAELVARDLDELEYLLSRNPLYRVYFADEARVPRGIGSINRIWFDAMRQGLDALRRRHLPLDEVADSVSM